MSRKILSTIIVLTMIFILLSGAISVNRVKAASTWYVDGALGTDDDTHGTGPGANAFKTIQYAINDGRVIAGDTINVAAGTYDEQILIQKSVTLIGAGRATTMIKAPADRANSVVQDTTTWDYIVAVYPTSGTIEVKIQDFTLDADNQNKTVGTTNFVGLFLRHVSGTGAGFYSCAIQGFPAAPEYESFGIKVYGNSQLTINNNVITSYTRDGIGVNGGASGNPNIDISNNQVTGSTVPLNAIYLGGGAKGTISGNTVQNHTRSAPWAACGILVDNADGITVMGNTVTNCFYGIFIGDADNCIVFGNMLTDNIKRAISLDTANGNRIADNTITGPDGGTDDTAIGMNNNCAGNVIGGNTPSDENNITMATSGTGNLYAIYMQANVDANNNTISYNTITGGQRAVQFDGPPGITGTTTITNNTFTGQAWGGITAYNNGSLVITNNTISDTARPLEFWQGSNGSITISGNTLTSTAYDVINAGSFGTMTVHNNNLSSTGSKGINNRTTTPIDAENNWWNSASGPAHVGNTYNVGSQGIPVSDYVDYTPWLDAAYPDGTSFAPVNNTTQSTQFSSIQAAIDAAAGTTITCAAGTYDEQVVINKSLTLQGAGAESTTIVAPESPTSFRFAESGSLWEPVVFAFGGDETEGVISGEEKIEVAISGFTIDGNNRLPTGRSVGILLRNAEGIISGNTVQNMSIDGKETFGIQVYGNSVITIAENNVSGYAKGGIVASGDNGTNPDPNAIITGNTVTGPGMNEVVTWAPNGIQIGWGATGKVIGNTVSGNGYPGTDWTGSGILVATSDGVEVDDNTVTGNETGIGSSGKIEDTWIHDNTVDGNTFGISIQNESVNTTIENNTITNSSYDGIDICNFTGYGPPPIGTTIQGNTITANNTENDETSGGIWVAGGVDGDEVSVHFNNIVDNNRFGVLNTSTTNTLDATNNWWGSASGPYDNKTLPGTPNYNNPLGTGDAVSSYVDYKPWFTTPTGFTITATAGVGGTISPSGNVTIDYGDSQSFTITANPGYLIARILVDGKPISFNNPFKYTYTFTNVKADHTITAEFIKQPDVIPPSLTLPTINGVDLNLPNTLIKVNTPTLTFTVQATDESGIARMVVKVNGVIQIDKNNLDPTITLSEGMNTVEVTVYDTYGNSATKSFKVLKDTQGPTIILPPDLPQTVSSNTFTLKGTVIDNVSGISTLTVNGKPVIPTLNGNFELQLTLTQGTNTIAIVAVDKLGNKTTKTITLSYNISQSKSYIIILKVGDPHININGIEKTIDAQSSKPIIQNDRTLLPIRVIIESLGGTVEWDNTQRKVTITLGYNTIELWIGKNTAKVNGVNKPIDSTNPKVVPEIINSRTYLPIRFICENLGANVNWDPQTQTITIYYWP